jgi:glycosyltransferase involved in cell wall biosynthesis
MTPELVSVVVPVFNGERYLRDALKSIAEQTYQPVEIVAVDDGSTDGSAAILAEHPAVRCIRVANGGVAAARNRGVEAALGAYIAFLDQDDRWLPGKLAAQVALLSDHPEAGFAITLQRFETEPGESPSAYIREKFLHADHPGYVPSALLARREAFDRVGRFVESYRYGSDADWFMRATEAAVSGVVVSEVLLLKRLHAENESRHAANNLAELRRALKASIDRKRTPVP